MRLRGKIFVMFTIVMILPVCLVFLAMLVILRTKFNFEDRNFTINRSMVTSIENSISFINNATRDSYNELLLCTKCDPGRIENREYLDSVAKKLSERYTYLYVMKEDRVLYGSNEELYGKIKGLFPFYSVQLKNNSEYFQQGDLQILTKYIILENGGEQTKIYLVSDISGLDEDAKMAVKQLFVSLILSVFVTGVILAFWIHRSIAKPIKDLKASTRRIIGGDLETAIRREQGGEVGELCRDFDEMREHIGNLLQENMKNEKNMREMIANISHDLKTPLTAIKGYSSGLLEGVASTPEKRDKYINTIIQKTDAMNELIEELAEYTKIDRNEEPYEFTKINLNDYIERGIERTRTEFELSDYRLIYKAGAEKDIRIMANTEQLNKAIRNIISNARKYGDPEKRGVMRIETKDAGDYVILSFTDNGRGIEEENLERVFDRFYREDSSRNSKIGGSGLGLAIVKKIVEEHGGMVWAESKIGIGTTINMVFKKAAEGNGERP